MTILRITMEYLLPDFDRAKLWFPPQAMCETGIPERDLISQGFHSAVDVPNPSWP